MEERLVIRIYRWGEEEPVFAFFPEENGDDDGGRDYVLPVGYTMDSEDGSPFIRGEKPCALQNHNGLPVLVDETGHLMGAYGVAILAKSSGVERPFQFDVAQMTFQTREACCGKCPNNCEVICVYRDGQLIDAWGNRCENGNMMKDPTRQTLPA